MSSTQMAFVEGSEYVVTDMLLVQKLFSEYNHDPFAHSLCAGARADGALAVRMRTPSAPYQASFVTFNAKGQKQQEMSYTTEDMVSDYAHCRRQMLYTNKGIFFVGANKNRVSLVQTVDSVLKVTHFDNDVTQCPRAIACSRDCRSLVVLGDYFGSRCFCFAVVVLFEEEHVDGKVEWRPQRVAVVRNEELRGVAFVDSPALSESAARPCHDGLLLLSAWGALFKVDDLSTGWFDVGGFVERVERVGWVEATSVETTPMQRLASGLFAKYPAGGFCRLVQDSLVNHWLVIVGYGNNVTTHDDGKVIGAKLEDGRLQTHVIVEWGSRSSDWGLNYARDVAPLPHGDGIVLLVSGPSDVEAGRVNRVGTVGTVGTVDKLVTVKTTAAVAMAAMSAVRCAWLSAVVKGCCLVQPPRAI
jgi:hypothetical protein